LLISCGVVVVGVVGLCVVWMRRAGNSTQRNMASEDAVSGIGPPGFGKAPSAPRSEHSGRTRATDQGN
jgi:hypothetical protein